MRHLKRAAILSGAIGGALLLAGQAVADPITVDGIQFDSGMIFGSGQIFENAVSAEGDTLSGYGQINTIGISPDNDEFCAGGGNCELTFAFNNYVVDSFNADQSQASFTGGTVKFFADSSADFDPSDMATATDGELFLSTVGHTFMDSGTGRTGTLLAQGANLNTSNAQGTGVGQLDVVGGDAAEFFDTDTQNDFMGGTSDILFNSSFSPCSGGTPTDICGSADIHGSATSGGGPVSVPEPGVLGLMGLGLLGIGFATRRRRR